MDSDFLSRPEIKTRNIITAQMIEKHREITQKAMQKVFGAIIKNETKPPVNEIKPIEASEFVESQTKALLINNLNVNIYQLS